MVVCQEVDLNVSCPYDFFKILDEGVLKGDKCLLKYLILTSQSGKKFC